jgi:hypothetical protein
MKKGEYQHSQMDSHGPKFLGQGLRDYTLFKLKTIRSELKRF